MRVLLTGGTGFLGTGLARGLLAAGASVTALVRPGSDASVLEEAGATIRPGDLRDTWSLLGVAKGADAIVHAAAVHRGGSLTRHDFWQVNSEGTRRLLQEAVAAGCRRFVYISTAGVHGNVAPGSAVETSPLRPSNLYETTKLRGEQAVRRIAHSDRLEAVILRPSTIYGPGDRRFLKLLRPIARRRFVLVGSGKVSTHFVYRDDVVDAVVAACSAPQAVGETYLVAGPEAVTMGQLVRSVADALGVPPPQMRVPYAPVWLLAHVVQAACRLARVEPPIYPRRLAFFGRNRRYDTRKLERSLAVTPRVALDVGLARLVEWYRAEALL